MLFSEPVNGSKGMEHSGWPGWGHLFVSGPGRPTPLSPRAQRPEGCCPPQGQAQEEKEQPAACRGTAGHGLVCRAWGCSHLPSQETLCVGAEVALPGLPRGPHPVDPDPPLLVSECTSDSLLHFSLCLAPISLAQWPPASCSVELPRTWQNSGAHAALPTRHSRCPWMGSRHQHFFSLFLSSFFFFLIQYLLV